MEGGDVLRKIQDKYTGGELTLLAKQTSPEYDVTEYFINLFENSNAASYLTIMRLFSEDLVEVPLYINDIDPEVRAIANWRLKIAK